MHSEEYMKSFFSSFEVIEKENNISEFHEENKYDSYFEGSEKLSDKAKFIENISIENKIIGRKYYNIKKEIKYIEILTNSKFDLLGISRNITFLYLYDKNEKKEYNENKFIGFRYYDIGQNQSNSKYFTLIKRYNTKFHILEKDESIKDINNKNFFDKELNCFSIINNIIIQKYKDKNHIMNGETFPEIIGYCYSLISLNIKNFIFLEPLIPEPLNPNNILKENIPVIDKNVTYIEPLIYNGHISLIIFNEINNNRCNLILDMSKYHINTSHLNTLIFPKSMNENNSIYSKNPIQNYSSCCLWFYGEINSILNNNKYTNMKSIYENLKDGDIRFYIDVINLIGKEFYEINEIFKYEPEMSKDIKNIDLNRLYVKGNKNYTVHKDIVFTQFLNINNFFKGFQYFYSSPEMKILIDTENKIEKFFNYKNLLDINYRFYGMIEQNNKVRNIMNMIEDEKKFIDESLIDIKRLYGFEFLKKNISSYELYFIDDILNDKVIFPISDKVLRKIEESDFNSFIKNKTSELKIRKRKLETDYCIYSEEDIVKQLNPSNEICFILMNK